MVVLVQQIHDLGCGSVQYPFQIGDSHEKSEKPDGVQAERVKCRRCSSHYAGDTGRLSKRRSHRQATGSCGLRALKGQGLDDSKFDASRGNRIARLDLEVQDVETLR